MIGDLYVGIGGWGYLIFTCNTVHGMLLFIARLFFIRMLLLSSEAFAFSVQFPYVWQILGQGL